MNIDQAMFLRQEKIRRYPQSRLAKMDRFMKCPINKRKHWSEFAENLLAFFEKTGFLTTKQCVAGNEFVRRQDERDAKKMEA